MNFTTFLKNVNSMFAFNLVRFKSVRKMISNFTKKEKKIERKKEKKMLFCGVYGFVSGIP